MKTFKIEFTRSALKDLEQISDFYLQKANEKVAEQLILLIENALLQLQTLPERGAEMHFLTRETGRLYQQFLANPFRLVYRIEGSRVYIVMVLYQKQSIQKALKNRLLQ